MCGYVCVLGEATFRPRWKPPPSQHRRRSAFLSAQVRLALTSMAAAGQKRMLGSWLQVCERESKRRCGHVQAVLAGPGSHREKYQTILCLMDEYMDWDSDLSLLDNVKVPEAGGPVLLPDCRVFPAVPECLSDSGPPRPSAVPSPQVLPSAASASTGVAPDAVAKPHPTLPVVDEKMNLIEANKAAALARRASKQLEDATRVADKAEPEDYWGLQWV